MVDLNQTDPDTFAAMAVRGRRLLEVSKRMQRAEFKLQAMHCAWANAFQMGELTASVATAADGLTWDIAAEKELRKIRSAAYLRDCRDGVHFGHRWSEKGDAP